MVLKVQAIEVRLKELDTIARASGAEPFVRTSLCPFCSPSVRLRIVSELSLLSKVTESQLGASLSLRWTVERGLIAAANMVFDIASSILPAAFGTYPQSYRESLALLKDKGVISATLWESLKELASLRNILAHEYLAVSLAELVAWLGKAPTVFPQLAAETTAWLATHRDKE